MIINQSCPAFDRPTRVSRRLRGSIFIRPNRTRQRVENQREFGRIENAREIKIDKWPRVRRTRRCFRGSNAGIVLFPMWNVLRQYRFGITIGYYHDLNTTSLKYRLKHVQ